MKLLFKALLIVGAFFTTSNAVNAQTKVVRPTEKQLKRDLEMYQGAKGMAGTKETSSGILYNIYNVGKGPRPKKTSTVTIKYRLMNLDLQYLEKRFENKPWQGPVNELMVGIQEALLLMPAGSKWLLHIPSSQCRDKTGKPIGDGRMLMCYVELVAVK